MKIFLRKFLILLIPAFCLFGCIKGEKETLKIPSSSYSIEFNASQSQPFILSIEANFLWAIECPDDWVFFSPSKASGDRDVEVTVRPNTSLDPRRTSFYIVGEHVRERINVVQKGESPDIVLRSNSRTVNATGGEFEVILDTNIEVDVTSNVAWIKRNVSNATKLMGQYSFFFSVEQNTGLDQRTGTITFKQRNGQVSQVYTVTQIGETPEIVVSQNTLAFDAEGGVKGVEVTSNVPLKITIDPAKTWVQTTDGIGTKLMETSTYFFLVEENPRAELREATVVISREGSTELNRILTITQAAAVPAISVTPEAFENISAAGTGTPSTLRHTINVDANFLWSVDFSETASWVTDIDFDATKCTFRVSPNETVSERATQIVFKQIDGTFSKAYRISQTGAEAQISLLYSVPDIKAVPEPIFIFVSANVPWQFYCDQTWLEVSRGVASGTEYLRCEATENTRRTPREAKITLVSDKTSLTVTVRQLAGDPQIYLSVTSMMVPPEESTTELTVTSNVGWTYTKDPMAYWIEVVPGPVSPTGAYGDSTILVKAAKNSEITPRSAKVTIRPTDPALASIAGLTKEVMVNQQGAEHAYTISPSSNNMSVLVGGLGGDLTVMIEANFKVEFKGADQLWVEYTGTSADSTRFYFTVKPVNTPAARESILTFQDKHNTGYKFPAIIHQKGATVSSADSLVLVKLYSGLSGLLWRDKWTLTDPVSEWKGVTLSDVIQSASAIGKAGERLVMGISLPNNLLVGMLEGGLLPRIPLEELLGLQILNLSGNLGLSGELPVNLSKLSGMRELDLSNCSFVNASSGRNVPKEWGLPAFPNLVTLKLYNNQLKGEIPSEISEDPRFGDLSLWNGAVNILRQRGGDLTVPPPTP